jgi:hypothetical protein
MKKIVVLSFILTTLLFAEAIDRTGPYIALGGGYSMFYDDARLAENTDPSYNIDLIGGVFINKYLSVELNFDYYDTFENSLGDTTDVYMIEAVAKAHYPVWRNRIDFYGAFGAGGMWWKENLNNVSQEDNSGVVSGDLGMGIRALKWLTLNMGYRRYYFTLDHQDLDSSVTRYYMEVSSAYANIEVQF